MSFANAGGANHLIDPSDNEGNLQDEDDALSVTEFENEDDSWYTDNAC